MPESRRKESEFPPGPRVRITYEEAGAGGEPRELPFVVGVLADLGGRRPPAELSFVDVDRESFDGFFRDRMPRLAIDDLQISFARPAELFEDGAVARRLDSGDRLAEVLRHPEFLRLAAAWRGLDFLVQAAERESSVRVRVLDVSREELARERDALRELMRKESASRLPFAAVVADYEWGRDREEMELLSQLAQSAAAIHAPLLTAPSPRLFDLESFSELDRFRDIAPVFGRAEYAAWNTLRDSQDSRYLAMAVPRFHAGPLHGIAPCWSNSAYAYAVALVQAFERYRWCGAACDLPPAWRPEVAITEPRAGELARLGFLPLLHDPEAGLSSFRSAPSAHRPRKWDTPAASSEEQLASNLPCLMAAARFVHYLKTIVRDWIGPVPGCEEIEKRLNRWLSGYLLLEGESSPEALARHPLREGRVEIRQAGSGFEAVARLRPHHLLRDVDVPLRMVVELPRPAGE
jgi:type VI secretion system protein ImpC